MEYNNNEKKDNNVNNNINDINFKNLVSILNQKFKKYLSNNSERKKLKKQIIIKI